MKQLLFALLAFNLIACGSSKGVRTSKQSIKGDWLLSSITYNASGTYNVTLLNDASESCFEGSLWKFVPNNNTGKYTIAKSGCSLGDRYFVFTIDELNPDFGLYDFLLKPTDEKYKSEDNRGFRLTLKSMTESTMQWDQTAKVAGQSLIISMHFTKTED